MSSHKEEMKVNKLTSATIKNLFIAGAKYLNERKEYVNELNVFPVPDGDTGTNMSLTILSAAKEVEAVDAFDMALIAKAISSGSLRGARGNSGVILSQLLRGFSKIIANHQELDLVAIAGAFEKGAETAYKAVMKPKEGTILTVASALAEKASELALSDEEPLAALGQIIAHGEAVLDQTPSMLPVLAEAGVVDAGGQGLIYILKGAYQALESGEEHRLADLSTSKEPVGQPVKIENKTYMSVEDIKYAYCTEFIINTKEGSDNERDTAYIKSYLETIGDSIVAVCDDDYIKIHVHTNEPGNAFQKALSFGYLTNMKIDNMKVQFTDRQSEKENKNQLEKSPTLKKDEIKRQPYGLIVVSAGEGIDQIFKGFKVDHIIGGGQSMNPSTDDFATAIESIPADTIFLFPNNKNIILAAEQAGKIIKDKQVIVIPTKTIPQGISALIGFDPDASPEENQAMMLELKGQIRSGEVTYAVRDTSIDGQSIHQNDILAIGEGKIVAVDKRVNQAVKDLLTQLVNEESEIITLYYGHDVTEQQAEQLQSELEGDYPEYEIELYFGGQPLYYYLVSIE